MVVIICTTSPFLNSCTGERYRFIVRKPFQITVRQSESHRISQCSGSGTVIHNFIRCYAEKIMIVLLKIILCGGRNLLKVFQSTNILNSNIIFFEQFLIKRRMSFKIPQKLMKFFFLKYFDFLNPCFLD